MFVDAYIRYKKYGKPELTVASWNIAAINNNPFEYWITHNDAAYNKLMTDVQNFIDAPGTKDVPVNTVRSPSLPGLCETPDFLWSTILVLRSSPGGR